MTYLDRYWGPNENFVLVSLWRWFWLLPSGSWLLGYQGRSPWLVSRLLLKFGLLQGLKPALTRQHGFAGG